jgi:hypothetical protein
MDIFDSSWIPAYAGMTLKNFTALLWSSNWLPVEPSACNADFYSVDVDLRRNDGPTTTALRLGV